MENKQYVQGYWRGQDKEEVKSESHPLIGAILLVGTVVLIAIILWQVTVGLMIAGGTGYLIKRRVDKVANGLLVNEMGKRRYI